MRDAYLIEEKVATDILLSAMETTKDPEQSCCCEALDKASSPLRSSDWIYYTIAFETKGNVGRLLKLCTGP